MMTLRCTQKLLKKFWIDGPLESDMPTTTLGDWYANILYTRQGYFIVSVGERSLLPVVLSAIELDKFVPRFREQLREILLKLGISDQSVVREIEQMFPFYYGRTKSKVILGTLNDFTQNLKFMLPQFNTYSEIDWALYFAETPCGPLDYRTPIEVTKELFKV